MTESSSGLYYLLPFTTIPHAAWGIVVNGILVIERKAINSPE
jgi:hypothetical protein